MSGNTAEIKRAFLDCYDKDPDAQQKKLDRLRESSPEIAQKVESLFQAADKAKGLDVHAHDYSTEDDRDPTELKGHFATTDQFDIDGYELVKEIGRGGMGVVFKARQISPIQRLVAIKIVRPGMDTQSILKRFSLESQWLSSLEHSNIAKIFDAGKTKTGLPYFAMEYVGGMPISDFCNQLELSIDERLELFLQACAGVQHAHRRGILHRDIKPSNILANKTEGKLAVKIIDFGIAKSLEEDGSNTALTIDSQVVGTPLYMSPERLRLGSNVMDTRSDVYSLGVVLYEMIAGCSPFASVDFSKLPLDEKYRIIRDFVPARPSSVLSTQHSKSSSRISNRSQTELDWIILKAIEKEPNERYESALALANDIERFRKGDPVEAGPPSSWYALSKMVRKHRVAAIGFAAVLLSLLLGIIGTTWQWQVAKANANEAQQRATNEKEVSNKLAQTVSEKVEQVRRANEAQLQAERLAYANQMYVAQTEWPFNNVALAYRKLESTDPRFRDFEYDLLRMEITSGEIASARSETPIQNMIAHPDNERFLVFFEDGRVSQWRIDTCEPIGELEIELKGKMQKVGFTGDHKSLVVVSIETERVTTRNPDASLNFLVNVFDSKTFQLERKLTIPGPFEIAFSPTDSKVAIYRQDGTFGVYDLSTGKTLCQAKCLVRSDATICGVFFSKDETKLEIIRQDHFAFSFDLEAEELSKPRSLRFSDKELPIALRNDRNLRSDIKRVSVASKADQIACFHGFGIVYTRQWPSGLPNFYYTHPMPIEDLTITPDGSKLITGCQDGIIRIWNTTTGECLERYGLHQSQVKSVCLTPDATRIISKDLENGVRTWDANKVAVHGKIQTTLKRPIHFALNDHLGLLAMAGSDDNNMITSRHLEKKLARPFKTEFDSIEEVRFHPKQPEVIATGLPLSPIARRRNARTGEVIQDIPLNGGLVSLAYSNDGVFLAVSVTRNLGKGAPLGGIEIWNLETNQRVKDLSIPGYLAWVLEFSPDGSMLAARCGSGGLGGKTEVWDTTDWTKIYTDENSPPGSYKSLSFSYDNRYLACCGDASTYIRLIDMQDGSTSDLATFNEPIRSVQFHPSTNRLLSGSRYGKVRIWDYEIGESLMELHESANSVHNVSVTSDLNVVIGTEGRSVRIWNFHDWHPPTTNPEASKAKSD